MERRLLTTIALCFLILFGWQKFYIEPRTQQFAQQAPAAAPVSPATAQNPNAPAVVAPTTPATPSRPHETLVLNTSQGEITIGDTLKTVQGWKLKNFHQAMDPSSPLVDLTTVTHQAEQLDILFDDPALSYLNQAQGTLASVPQGVLWTFEDANVKLRREFTEVPGQPYMMLNFSAEFKTRKPNFLFFSLQSASPEKDIEVQDRKLVYWTEQSLSDQMLKDASTQKDVLTPVRFAAATSRYFNLAVVNQSPIEAKAQIQPVGPQHARISLVYPVTASAIQIPLRVYFGPKELETLRAVDPALDNTVDLGWFQVVAYPLLKLLKILHKFVNNYGVAIILLTLFVKLVTYPLNYKSMKSMKEMARLQPQLQKIKEKYADDKERLNQEMLQLMKTHGYNPAAGCLPMLIQMPIFFALYRVLYSSIELLHAPFGFWIHDLSVRDPYYITPVLLTGVMFVQQRLQPQTAADPAQQKMMQFMPLMFGFMMINLPSGLTIYMLTNALASIAQQMMLNKALDAKGGTVVTSRA